MNENQRRTDDVDAHRRRATALRTLAQRPRPGSESPEWQSALLEFGGEAELLLAIHQRWQTNLLARLDQVLELGSDDMHDDVVRAVEKLGRDLPGFAFVLSRHADDPVLARARWRLTQYVNQACPCGRRHPLVAAPRPARSSSRCLVRRACARWRHSWMPQPRAVS